MSFATGNHNMISRIIRHFNKAIEIFLVLLVIALFGIVLLQVLFRYVLGSPLTWPEEITRLMLIWLTFLGSYVTLREGRHMNFELLIERVPFKLRLVLKILREILVLIFMYVIMVEGMKFSIQFYDVVLPYTNISVGMFVYSVFPVSGILMCITIIINAYRMLQSEISSSTTHQIKPQEV